jgi:2-keto-4-pentenoate hydratase/2-oxohepta-3-ene-1,7-dioic acid hydratase in catechol pathway
LKSSKGRSALRTAAGAFEAEHPDVKIARIAERSGKTCWAAVEADAGSVRRITAPFERWAPLFSQVGVEALELRAQREALAEISLLAPVPEQGRIFGVGLNYLAHLTRLGRTQAPPHTIGYIKPHSAIVAPGAQITYPAVTSQLDFEIELVAVVARPLNEEEQSSNCLLGYTIGNDVSARDAGKQLGVLDLFTQKALDRTAPVGPWITTLDEFGGAGQPEVDMVLRVNGEVRQQDNTRSMLFSIDEILNFINARVALRSGDVIFTGSTAGVGLEDGRFLMPGDLLEGTIERIGKLSNRIGEKRQLSPARSAGRLGITL